MLLNSCFAVHWESFGCKKTDSGFGCSIRGLCLFQFFNLLLKIRYDALHLLCENSSPERGLRLSDEMNRQLCAIKEFNYKHIYANPRMKPFTEYSNLIIRSIFEKLRTYFKGASTISYISKDDAEAYGFVRDFADWLVRYVDDGVEAPDKYNEVNYSATSNRASEQ